MVVLRSNSLRSDRRENPAVKLSHIYGRFVLPVVAVLVAELFVLALWRALENVEDDHVARLAALGTENAAVHLANDAAQRLFSVNLLARALDREDPQAALDAWRVEAGRLLTSQPGFAAVYLLDAEGAVRESVPAAAASGWEAMAGQTGSGEHASVRDEIRAYEFDCVVDVRGADEDAGVLLLVSAYRQEREPAGYVVAVLNGRRWLNNLLPNLPLGLNLVVYEGGRLLYQHSGAVRLRDSHLAGVARAQFANASLEVHGWPNPDIVARKHSELPKFSLAVGSITAVLLGLTLFFAQTSRFRARQAEKVNRELQAAIRVREEAEKRFRLLVESSPDAVVITDGDDRIILVNAMAERVFRCPRHEQLSHSFAENIQEEHREDYRQAHAACLVGPAEQTSRALFAMCLRRDREVFPAELAMSALNTDQGLMVFNAVRDVTQQQSAQQTMRLQSAALESAANAIVITDRSGNIVWVNPAFSRLTGYEAAEVLGRSTRVLRSGRQAPEFYAQMWETVLSGKNWEGDIINRRKDGSEYFETMTITPVRDATGAVTHFIAIKQDVTERRRVESMLAERARELARSNAELQQFAHVASHDLQEPLRMVASYVQLLAKRYRGKLDQNADEFINFAVGGATRMQELLNALLEYSRVHTKAQPFGDVPLETCLRDALANLRLAVHDTAAVVTHDPLPRVQGDRTQLTQLFQNLLANAIKFRGEAAPRVHVGAERVEGKWKISVTDNGIGVEPQYAHRIFVIFQRLHQPGRYPGTGVGLAICKKIVERHGGEIGMTAAPTRGSVFFFTLPDNAGETNDRAEIKEPLGAPGPETAVEAASASGLSAGGNT